MPVGNSELISSGRTGLLFNSENVEDLATELKWLIDDRNLRAKLGKNAAQSMHEGFSLAASTQAMQNIYSSFFERTLDSRVAKSLRAPPGLGGIEPCVLFCNAC